MKKTVLHVVGARPNFMKVAPIYQAIAKEGRLNQLLVHTGQHYDVKMSDVFFTDLGMSAPDIHLGIGSGSHAAQTAKIMIELEKVFLERRPDLVSVVGDVNSTLAATLVASKLQIPVSHVEAGLRSYDRSMPEEINRMVTDRLSDYLLTPSADADLNLAREGVEKERIFLVGNVMIDSLLTSRAKALDRPTLAQLGLKPSSYAVCTLHRPSNVDDPKVLTRLARALGTVSRRLPVVFPVHPRTRKMLEEHKGGSAFGEQADVRLIEPLGYLDFLSLSSQARLILTDSGGLQEESTALGIPCLTLRENTERPITVEVGSNLVVGTDTGKIISEASLVLEGKGKKGQVPALWDGHAGERIAQLYGRLLS